MNSDRPTQPIVVLISGRGSNLQALAEHGRETAQAYRIALVLSDRPAAPGLGVARDLGLPARAIRGPPGPAPSAADPGILDHRHERAVYESLLAAAIDEHRPALIVLAGFMRILSPEFVARYPGRIVNIHPSLLPRHPGLNTHRRVLAARDPLHGATVHFVTAALDGGPPIIQARVAVSPDDDEVTLAARVLALEHEIYPLAVGWYCEGRLCCRGGRAWLDGAALAQPVLYRGDALRGS